MIKSIANGMIASAAVMLAVSSPTVRAGILQTFDFETGDLSQLGSTELEGPTATVAASTVIARRGSYSMKTSIATADKRAEGVSQLRGTVGGVNWYGWSIYVPSGHVGDGSSDIVSQFHDWHSTQPAWAKDGTAPTCFLFKTSGILQLDLKYQSAPQTPAHQSFNLGAYTTGAWHDIVVNVKWTHLSTGFLRVWVNGVLKVDYTGPTYLDYGAGNGPYFKMGNYKGIYNWSGTSPRIFYMDEFRMGDANSSYDEVNPLPSTDALLAYEGFNYPAGALSSANGGLGWSGAWAGGGGAGVTEILSGSHAWTGLPVTGKRFRIYDTDGAHQSIVRTLATTFGAAEETYWLSFLVKKFSSGREAYLDLGGLGFKATSGNWQVKTPSTSYADIPGSNYSGLRLIVARVDATLSGDTVRVWVDPVIASGEPSLASAAVTRSDPGFTFNTVRIKHGPWGSSTESGEWDELRLGRTFDAVVTGGGLDVDNADTAQVASTGTWTTSTGTPGYLGGNYVHDGNTAKGTKTFSFMPAITTAADYLVYARWPADANRASNVPVDIIKTGGAISTVTINQQVNSNTWTLLGVFPLSPADAEVRFRTTGTNGYVMADGVRVVRVPSGGLDVDNADTAQIASTGTWATSTSTPGYLGTNYAHDGNTAKGARTFSFKPAITTAGDYVVYGRWPADANRASNVPVDIIKSGGAISTVTVNQQVNSNTWTLLGVFPLSLANAEVRFRTTGTNGYVIADGVRFVKAPAQ